MNRPSNNLPFIFSESLPTGVIFSMIQIKGGRFNMGTEEGSYFLFNPKPAHVVVLDTFFLGQCTVTEEIWHSVMGTSGGYVKDLDLPMVQVSWQNVQVFLMRLNELLNLSRPHLYRLPTEAEWEYAARGGQHTNMLSSSSEYQLEQIGWYDTNSHRECQPIALKAPTELGLYDMKGNVWEWCADWHSNDYYTECLEIGRVKNPLGPKSGKFRVLRGGSWFDLTESCEVISREDGLPEIRDNRWGFRLARSFVN